MCLTGVFVLSVHFQWNTLKSVCTTWCVCEELVGHVSQRKDGDHTVVAIGFNEVVASDGGWVDVVLPEWSNKCLQRQRERDRERE